jgi:hypothetical protein
MKIADIFNATKRTIIIEMKYLKSIFPCPSIIYEKDIVLEQMNRLGMGIATEDLDNSLNKSGKCPSNPLFKAKDRSRFDFTINSNTVNDSVNVPQFISKFISKNFALFYFRKKIFKDDYPVNYLIGNSIFREYNEYNPWARFIISNDGERIFLEKLAEDEEKQFLKKFKSA